jgi:hypothetical protein
VIRRVEKREAKTPKGKPLGPQAYVSKKINLDISKIEKEFYRADIEIHNVDHSGPSYEGRVFLNNPNANQAYHVFGHGGCFGDMGHCDVPTERRMYDHRPSHQLKPQYKRITITDALKQIGKTTNKFIVTIVPYRYGQSSKGKSDIVKFEKIGIITYDKT